MTANPLSSLASPLYGLRVAVSNLGCKVNASESDSFVSQFQAVGCRIVPFDGEADVYVVNTCTVTSSADRKSRQELRQARRANALALVVATGCYVSVANRDLDSVLPGNALIVHNMRKQSLVELVAREIALQRGCGDEFVRAAAIPASLGRAGAPATLLPVAIGADTQRTRATLKVQDGCNAGCSFCIIPRARGGPRSVPLDDAVDAAKTLETHGYREIVLTGILLGSYGRDLDGDVTLLTLLERLLAETTNVRFRVSSIEPQDLRPAWLALWNDGRMCKHLHLPLQSGSESILMAMRRQYSLACYQSLVEEARSRIPDLAVTTDLLVGFPGESDREFAETQLFVERMRFADMHVFRYSSRPGTAAARLPDHLTEHVKQARSEAMRSLAHRARADFNAAFVGSAAEVLWERSSGLYRHGVTSNYLQVYTHSANSKRNHVQQCRLTGLHEGGLWADPLDPGAEV